jgi:glucose-1-phosphate cytidylyltransferase
MKVVILAGGYGTRLSEYTKDIPKPLVIINGKPILIHIIKHYKKYGFKDFYIATGYKGNLIREYFKKNIIKNCNINLIDTGLKTMTGGRLLRMKKFLINETFLMTYGDGLSDVNLSKLIQFHKKKKKFFTLTAVRPPARFGAVYLKGSLVKKFREKSQLDEGWINGGFFVIEPEFFKLIKNDRTYLEKEPLEKLVKMKQLVAFKYSGFWQCMDTKRDKEYLEKILKKKNKKNYYYFN